MVESKLVHLELCREEDHQRWVWDMSDGDWQQALGHMRQSCASMEANENAAMCYLQFLIGIVERDCDRRCDLPPHVQRALVSIAAIVEHIVQSPNNVNSHDLSLVACRESTKAMWSWTGRSRYTMLLHD
jgi:hypothetical protein